MRIWTSWGEEEGLTSTILSSRGLHSLEAASSVSSPLVDEWTSTSCTDDDDDVGCREEGGGGERRKHTLGDVDTQSRDRSTGSAAERKVDDGHDSDEVTYCWSRR